jgi:hypothetical protein
VVNYLCGVDWSLVPAWSHKPLDAGSNPASASKFSKGHVATSKSLGTCSVRILRRSFGLSKSRVRQRAA